MIPAADVNQEIGVPGKTTAVGTCHGMSLQATGDGTVGPCHGPFVWFPVSGIPTSCGIIVINHIILSCFN